ncbi:MAG: hypothetical protein LLG37_01660 [Spirochaetia bacterium]|nr:hypothetical protein [Spirochaetia bacterium]
MENTAVKRGYQYGDRMLLLSWHAFERMLERACCRTDEEVRGRIERALCEGYEYKDMGRNRGKRGLPRETVITHRDICLHVRENTITTVLPNSAFFYAA